MKKTKKNYSGQVLIDLLIALAIFAIIITPFLSAVINLMNTQVKYRHRIKATQLTREILEIAYNLSANTEDWATFSSLADDPSQPFKPKINGSGYFQLETGTDTIEGLFTRSLFFNHEDANTLEAYGQVTWTERGHLQKVTITTYLINFSQLDV